jgi:hypothetical protein
MGRLGRRSDEDAVGDRDVGIVSLKVVNRGLDDIPAALARTERMHHVNNYLQRLEWHHRFIIFCKTSP